MDAVSVSRRSRLLSLVREFDRYRKGTIEMIERPIHFAPDFLDFLRAPFKTIVTLIAQFRYFRLTKIGTPKEVEHAYERLLFAYTKQLYGLRLNVVSFLSIGKLEGETLSRKQIRKILADTTIYSDANGRLGYSAQHSLVDFCAKSVAVVLSAIGAVLFVGLSIEIFKANCVPFCVWFGASELFSLIFLLIWGSYRIGFRVPRIDLIKAFIST